MLPSPSSSSPQRSGPPAPVVWLSSWCLAAAVVQLLEMAGDGLARGGLVALLGLRLLSAALGGLAVGWVLRWRLRALPLGLWVLLSALGSGIALALLNVLWSATLVPAAEGPLDLLLPQTSWLPAPLLLALAGAIIGGVQLPALRGALPGAAGWPAVTALAALVSQGAAVAFRGVLGPSGLPVQIRDGHPLPWIISAVAAALAALLTGAFLMWRRPG